LHWCATGLFSSLPFHAAGIHNGSHKICCSDFVVSSYTPTITALLRVRRVTTPLIRENISLALVAEKQALWQGNLKLTPIPEVDKEIEHVAAVAKLSNVNIAHQQTGSTTVVETAAAMQVANIVHLACHGTQDDSDATQSGYCLGDCRLTITKLTELKLDDAFLAFLSACETAMGDVEQSDQAMHLAAAMLFIGFKNVVATMWYVHGCRDKRACANAEQGNMRLGWSKRRQVVLRGATFQRYSEY
jgi:CHAT domain-containing protein